MIEENVGLEKSLNFAVRIVNLCKYLQSTRSEHTMSKQLLRCGTSIGANLREATCSISRKEFLSKAYISLKEASETEYWLLLLHRTKYLTDEEFNSMKADCDELLRIIAASTNTARKNLRMKRAKIGSIMAVLSLISVLFI